MRQRESATTSGPPITSAKDFSAATTASENEASDVPMVAHRNPPQPDPACLYGLIGDVALAGSDTSETNPYAIAANFMAYLSCAIGRSAYLPIGNTWHHTRLFCLHIGRSGRGRKGDALSLVMRLDQALRELNADVAPQIHRGGLSTREGLVALIHDGYKHGAQEVAPIEDKRLWVVASPAENHDLKPRLFRFQSVFQHVTDACPHHNSLISRAGGQPPTVVGPQQDAIQHPTTYDVATTDQHRLSAARLLQERAS